jgi:serine protease Do
VLEDTPAAEVGFEREDVIVSFDGKQIEEHDDLPLMVANTAVGTTVTVQVVREGKVLSLTPTVGELKDAPDSKKVDTEELTPDKLGLIVEELTPRYSRQMGQEEPEGVVITQVAPNSSGEKAGLLRGDILLEVNRRPVSNPVDYTKVLEKIGKDKVILLLVRRKEGTRFLTLRSDS